MKEYVRIVVKLSKSTEFTDTFTDTWAFFGLFKPFRRLNIKHLRIGGEGRNRTHLGPFDEPTTVLKTARTTRHPSLSVNSLNTDHSSSLVSTQKMTRFLSCGSIVDVRCSNRSSKVSVWLELSVLLLPDPGIVRSEVWSICSVHSQRPRTRLRLKELTSTSRYVA